MSTEPWMRGTYLELDPLRRGVVHALELAREDVERWCGALNDAQMMARPADLPPVAFHLLHMVRSLDRLLTYAEGHSLGERQQAMLATEMTTGTAREVLTEFEEGLSAAESRVRRFLPETYDAPRGIGRKQLPSTVAGLLIHCAEHTARHAGQVVTTVKVVRGVPGI